MEPPSIAFQCECGKLALAPIAALGQPEFKITEDHPSLKCPECGGYGIKLSAPVPGSDLVRAGINDLVGMLRRAIDDNYLTLCWYLWESLRAFTPRLREIYKLSERIFDLHTRNLLQAALSHDKTGVFRIDPEDARQEDIMLQMMLLSHITETSELFDIIVTIAAIARSEHFLIRDDGLSINGGVGLQITFEEGEQKRLASRLKTARQEVLKAKCIRLSQLMKRCFNAELRNAFAHSEYEIVPEGIKLTRYNRTISEDDLADAFVGSFYILKVFYEFLVEERERFIASGGFTDGGWTITPNVADGQFQITITGRAPGPSVTGRVRRERWKAERGVDPL